MTARGRALAALMAGLILLLAGCDTAEIPAVQEWPLACENMSFELPASLAENCARRGENGQLLLRPEVLALIEPGSAVQTLRVGDQWLFALNGKMAPALAFDNGPDYFREGLARTQKNNRIGFVDESLEIVVETVWDFAFPFENGLAIVCSGCRQVKDGEHTSIEGGEWGYIDSSGVMLVKPVHSRDALPSAPRRNPTGSTNQ